MIHTVSRHFSETKWTHGSRILNILYVNTSMYIYIYIYILIYKCKIYSVKFVVPCLNHGLFVWSTNAHVQIKEKKSNSLQVSISHHHHECFRPKYRYLKSLHINRLRGVANCTIIVAGENPSPVDPVLRRLISAARANPGDNIARHRAGFRRFRFFAKSRSPHCNDRHHKNGPF